jgi:poly(hydroxyalkanoate) depolymerase family esterase
LCAAAALQALRTPKAPPQNQKEAPMPWNDTMKQLMGKATELVRNGRLTEATHAIQQALGNPAARTHTPPDAAAPGHAPAPARWRPTAATDIEDAVLVEPRRDAASEVGPVWESTPDPSPSPSPSPSSAPSPSPAPVQAPAPVPRAAAHPHAEAPGSFTRVAFHHPGVGHGVHHYHLYVPPGADAATPMPLVLMLHGCTQNPVDFAAGTRMNSAAAPVNALVLYPEQPQNANPNGCWNWFRPEDQHRGRGEPGLLVAMVRDVMARHPVDAARVYAAGLSAGGAMAALLGREYPDVFAAVGVHSGLQAGAAHNVMAALSAMKNGAKPHSRSAPVAAPGQRVVPTIVFHGDADATVHARNGEQAVAAALGTGAGAQGTVDKRVEQGRSAAGKAYTRTVYRQGASSVAGPAMAEHWVLHGSGHAWAGGSAQGSHTDPGGVDATAEMLRFFMEHRR